MACKICGSHEHTCEPNGVFDVRLALVLHGYISAADLAAPEKYRAALKIMLREYLNRGGYLVMSAAALERVLAEMRSRTETNKRIVH